VGILSDAEHRSGTDQGQRRACQGYSSDILPAACGSELSRNRKKSLIPDATASLARIALRAALRPLFYFPIPARSAGRFSSILSLSPVAWFKCDFQDQENRVIIGVSSYC
jgi:hypothetical protein